MILSDETRQKLINELFFMDAQQIITDEEGGRELAWYYWRDRIEELLGVPQGTLDSYKKYDGNIELLSSALDLFHGTDD